MTKHTPGPWKLGEVNEYLGYDCMSAGVRCGPCVVLDGADYGQRDNRPDWREQMLADARLIAAAPQLVEALRECVTWLDPLSISHCETDGRLRVDRELARSAAKAALKAAGIEP